MSNPRVERALVLATAIADHRTEIAKLETEFEQLVSGRGTRAQVSNGHVANGKPKRRIRRVIRRSSSNRDRIFQAFKRAGEPVKLLNLRKKLGVSESCLHTNVTRLVEDKQLERVSHGVYQVKS